MKAWILLAVICVIAVILYFWADKRLETKFPEPVQEFQDPGVWRD